MNVAVHLEPASGPAPRVTYRWDADTEILIAQLDVEKTGAGMSGTVEIQGADGSWLMFDVASGRIRAVEIAVWPDVFKRPSLTAPATIEDAIVTIPARASQPGIASLGVDTPIMAEADIAKKLIHFRVGARREVRVVRMGRDVLLEVDSRSHIAGLWLLNVPPSPSN